MIRSSTACLALLACASAAPAELTVQEIEEHPATAEIVDFFRLGQGDLLLRVHDHPWSVVYILAADGTVRERTQTPWDTDQFVVPYLNGFAVQRPPEIVAFRHAGDPQPKVLYTSGPPVQSARLYASPDGQDLYVNETGTSGNRITRLDANGQVAWQQSIRRMESSTFITTDDGVAFVEKPYDLTLRAIGRDGRPRWETSVPQTSIYEPIYSPAGFITLPLLPTSPQEWDQRRLLNFDVRTGQLVSDVRVPPFAYATGTRHGLLVAGWMLGQQYVGMLDRNGRFAWLRRYVADPKISDIQQAAMTRDDRLALVTREREATTATPPTSIVITDTTAASLAEARGSCLVANWKPSVEHFTQLQKRGLWVLPPKPQELGWSGQGCSDQERQFVSFMQGLMAAMPAAAAPSHDSRQVIAVRVTSSGKPTRLQQYSADRSGYPTAGVRLTFVAPFDRAAEFWKVVATQVQPHLDRMKALHDRFEQTTGFEYLAEARGDLDYARTFAELQSAARKVDQKIAQLPPAQLADVRKTPPVGEVLILLTLDGFGGVDNMLQPVDLADQTFLDIVAKHRRAVARGEIVIRD